MFSKAFLFRVVQPFPKQALVFTCLQYMSSENTVVKGEIAISPFPTMFSTLLENFLPLSSSLKLLFANSVWKSPKFVICERVKVKTVVKS